LICIIKQGLPNYNIQDSNVNLRGYCNVTEERLHECEEGFCAFAFTALYCCLNIKINTSKQTKRYHARYHILLFIISDLKLN